MRVINESGDIKCMDEKGNVKWLSQNIVDHSSVLKDYNIKVVDAPEKLDPVITEKEIKKVETKTK